MRRDAGYAAAGVMAVLLCAPSAGAQERSEPGPRPPEEATEPQGLVAEPDVVQRAILFADRNLGGEGTGGGFYVNFGDMISGSGWIAVGPGYRWWLADDRAVVDASASLSWRGYKAVQATIEAPQLAKSRLTLGSQLRWQDFVQINFFGEGPDTFETDESEFRLRSTNLAGYALVRPREWLAVGAQVGWLQPLIDRPAGFFRSGNPHTVDRFPGDPVFAVVDQPSFAHAELSVIADTRDFPEHPLRGGVVRAAASSFSDRDTGVFSFERYEAEAAQFVPFAGGRLVLGVHGWLVGTDTEPGQQVPFYLQATLGGHNSLRSFADYRFHGRNMLLVNVETRVAMMTHVDAVAFFDGGNVAARVGDLDLVQRSYGAGVRLHSRRQTYARFDVARGAEGWRFLFRLHDPLRLSRIARRTAAVPFVH